MLKTKCKSNYYNHIKEFCQEQHIHHHAETQGQEVEIKVERSDELERINNQIKRLEFLEQNY